jgi:OPA family glycerol-3-phosphate transporter-like MFS transporter
MYLATVGLCLVAIVVMYFANNPLKHDRPFMLRRFINWLPLGLTYAFLCMGRYNMIVAKGALGTLMTKEDLGIIFGVGTWTYALSFLINGPLIDKKLGGKTGIIIAAVGASLANLTLGVLTYLIVVRHLQVNLVLAFSLVYAVNMYFQSYGAMSIIKVKAYWFHVRERGVFGAIFGTLISFGVYFAFDWGGAIVQLTRASADDNWLKRLFAAGDRPVDATWAVFFIPAVILLFWALVDWWLIRNTPEDAGFPHLDTCDASSGQMHIEFSVLDLLKKIFASPLMLMIAGVELTSGVFRYCALTWYPSFAREVPQPGAEFFANHWGWFTCIFGIVGGFTGGIVSDKLFHSRRGPPAAILCSLVLVLAVIMAATLFTGPQMVGWSAVLIVMASIGITSLMSGTAATDFGGRKATATCAGVVDGFAYIGSSIQSFSLGFIITRGGWHWWPLYIIPFAVAGLVLALKIWHDLPHATRKYISEVEQKRLDAAEPVN